MDGPGATRTIAGYELVGVIGEGGMGVVYEALQLSPRRTVALKLLRPGLVTEERIRRFRHEAQILGWLNHPGIAQIYESGVAETPDGPRPFLAMELVDGLRVDRWAGEHELDTAARLELVARICEAVHHAHQKGIVHRDLKPANILVDRSGQPKVLDFGVARILDADVETTTLRTRPGEVLGTLPYMSPEQVLADPAAIDTRSDVYALGVLAYELVGGQRPFELGSRALHEAARVIVEDEPTTLSALDARLAGDVEVLVAKAMAKDKERRYVSAEELAKDIRRHLADEPIEARPASRMVLLRKFTRRNRALVGGMAAVFTTLFIGAALSTTLFLKVRGEARQNELLGEQNRLEAQRKAELSEKYRRESLTARQTVAFLEDIFESSRPGEEIVSARRLVQRSAARIRDRIDADPAVRGRLLGVLGRALTLLGYPQDARPLMDEAVAVLREVHGEDSAEVANVEAYRGHVLFFEGREDEAEAVLRRAVRTLRRQLGPESDELATAQNNLGVVLRSSGSWSEAEELFRESLRIHTLHWGEDHPRTQPARNNRASALLELGRLREAEALYREALASPLTDAGRLHVLLTLGGLLGSYGDRAEAEEVLTEAVSIAREFYGEGSTLYLEARRALAVVYTERGRAAEAAEILFEVVPATESVHGADSVETIQALHDLAYALSDIPVHDEAEAVYLDVLERLRRTGRERHPLYFMAQHNLSFTYLDTGRLEQAEEVVRSAYDARVEEIGEDHPATLSSLRALATLARRQGRAEEASELRRRCVAGAERVHGDTAAFTQEVRMELGRVLRQLGRDEDAEQVFLTVWDHVDAMRPAWHRRAEVLREIVELYEQTGRVDEARRFRSAAE